MALLNILHFPDPRLRTQAKPISQVNESIVKLADDMLETMYQAPGIGLAATQVNIAKQIVVIDISENHDEPLCLINPTITHKEGLEEMEEGCLSVPEVTENVQRAEKITVQYIDLEGTHQQLDADDLLAVCIQHELDHLDGKLFIDYLSKLKVQRIRKKLAKRAKAK